jgi:Protein of unknown function (DUF5818)
VVNNTDAADRENGGSSVKIFGRLTNEGVECQALRGDDGHLYTLLGDLGALPVETRVCVSGERVEFASCQQGISIRVRSIIPADATPKEQLRCDGSPP